jgi:hypothetical protein
VEGTVGWSSIGRVEPLATLRNEGGTTSVSVFAISGLRHSPPPKNGFSK